MLQTVLSGFTNLPINDIETIKILYGNALSPRNGQAYYDLRLYGVPTGEKSQAFVRLICLPSRVLVVIRLDSFPCPKCDDSTINRVSCAELRSALKPAHFLRVRPRKINSLPL